jgi:hypothetical protein
MSSRNVQQARMGVEMNRLHVMHNENDVEFLRFIGRLSVSLPGNGFANPEDDSGRLNGRFQIENIVSGRQKP